jgi:putative transposase
MSFLIRWSRCDSGMDVLFTGMWSCRSMFHLLLSEPAVTALATVIRALKLSVSKRLVERPFWTTRYYDFNVFTDRKRIEKLKYTHRNPVVRGLVERPEDWGWSSFRHYLTGEIGVVGIESWTKTSLLVKDPG